VTAPCTDSGLDQMTASTDTNTQIKYFI
jgi:hypothetical protein